MIMAKRVRSLSRYDNRKEHSLKRARVNRMLKDKSNINQTYNKENQAFDAKASSSMVLYQEGPSTSHYMTEVRPNTDMLKEILERLARIEKRYSEAEAP